MAINVTAGKGVGTQGMNLADQRRKDVFENQGITMGDITPEGRKTLGTVDTETFVRPEETEAEGDALDQFMKGQDAAVRQELESTTALTPAPVRPENMEELARQQEEAEINAAQREAEKVLPISRALGADNWDDLKIKLSEEIKNVDVTNEAEIEKLNTTAPLNGAFWRAHKMANYYIPGSTLSAVAAATLLSRSYRDEAGNVIPNWDSALTAQKRARVLRKRDEKFKGKTTEEDYASEEFQTGLFGIELDKAISEKDDATKGKEVDYEPDFPIFKESRLNTNNTNIIFHHDLLDAGIETTSKSGNPTLSLDPKFKEVMSLATEASLMEQMFTSDDDATTVSAPDERGYSTKTLRVSASKGSNRLGRDIFQSWKRQQAQDLELPTDSYLDNYNQINSAVFTHIGNMAKSYYSQVNSRLFKELPKEVNESTRSKDEFVQTEFELTNYGIDTFTKLHRANWGLFSNEEVKPLNAPSTTGLFMFEGSTRTKDETTKIPNKREGDLALLNEARKNMNSVAMVTEQRRLSVALMMGMLGLVNAGGQNPATGKYNFDRTDQANKDYANMFGIGQAKYEAMVSEKKTLEESARIAAQNGEAEKSRSLKKLADSYDPDHILNLEREKFIGIIEGAGRYSTTTDGNAIPNYLTFAIQSLTGRMHAQQTIFNPQAHKLIRFIVGGKNKYTWKPGDKSKLDKNFKVGISAKLFEHKFKKKYKFKRTNKERENVFDDLANQTSPDSEYKKFVRWGKELQVLINNFDTRKAKEQLAGFKTVKNDAEQIALKKNIRDSMPDKNPIKDKLLREFLADEEEEGIAMADYLMELAAYDTAKKNNTSHTSSVIFEADGITHGPSTMAMILGSTSIAKRGGVLIDQDFSKMLDSNDWADLRDHMARIMLTTLDENSATIGIGDNKKHYERLLKLAIEDRQNFLKQSPMTMGYGQEIMSLKDHVNITIFLNPKIEALINNEFNGNFDLASDFLHSILVDSIYKTFEPETINASKLIKNNAYASAMTDIDIVIDAPAGNALAILGGESVQQKFQTKFSETVMEDGRIKLDKKGNPVKPKQRAVTHYAEAYTPSAARGTNFKIQGGWTTGRLLPSLVQPYDANMVARTFSGRSWEKIIAASTAQGNKDPFVLPIFDAFLVDLGSMDIVIEEANKHHVESIINQNYVEKIAHTWYSNWKQTINKIPDNTPLSQIKFKEFIRDPIEQEEESYNWSDAKAGLGPFRMLAMMVNSQLDLQKMFARTKQYDQLGFSLKDWKDDVWKQAGIDTRRALDEIKKRGINLAADDITGKELKEIIDVIIIGPIGLDLNQRNKELIEITEKKRKNLIALIKKQIAEGRLSMNINI